MRPKRRSIRAPPPALASLPSQCGLELHSPGILFLGPLLIAELVLDEGSCQVGAGEVRVTYEGMIDVGQGAVELHQLHESDAPIEKDLGRARSKFKGAIEVIDRLLEVSEMDVCGSPIEIGIDTLRVVRQRNTEFLDSLGVLLLVEMMFPQHAMAACCAYPRAPR